MIGQMQMTTDGNILDKVQLSIKRLKAFEPPEGYYVAFSGGKDSQCVYHLCKMAGVKFDAHYSVTSVDPPELVRFIKTNYPDVQFERRHDKNGKPVTMWSLIPERKMLPTRFSRYCCAELKESNGKGRFTVTGVRWAESPRRKESQGVITIPNKSATAKLKRELEENDVDFQTTIQGGVVLNYDDNPGRRYSEFCMRTGKAILNPIIDWDEEDVWQFLNENKIPHCCLYDEGFTRIGCIGCPMGGAENQKEQFERWPKYRELYLKAFKRMLEERVRKGLDTTWKDENDVMNWWLGEGKE